jgi:serine/threonine-protein kinase
MPAISGGCLVTVPTDPAPFNDPALPPTQEIPSLPPDTGSSTSIPTSRAIMLGKFRLLALLGEGGMGKVIRAEDTMLKRQVALKCLKKSASGKSYKPEQFIREARAAAALEHPHIVHIYETGEAGGYYYIAMELVEGGNLGSLVKACGPLDLARGCQLAAEAADAVAFATQHGITHRDIKPGNLMLSRAGRCKVTDFGLAHIADPADGFAMPKGAVGTPAYIAPEILQGYPATAKSDVYSLACTVFFLLTGKTPFHARDKAALLRMHIDMPAPDITSLRPDLPDSLGKVLARALSKNPDDRPGPDTFAKQLRAHTIPIGASQSVNITSSGPFVPTPPQGQAAGAARKNPLILYGSIAAGVLLLLIVGLVIAFSGNHKPKPPAVAVNPAPAPAAPAPATPAPLTPAPAPPAPAPLDTPPATMGGPAITTPVAPSPAPAARRNTAANTPAPSAELKASDTAALIAAAKSNSRVAVTGAVSDYTLNTDGERVAILRFKDAPDFTLLIESRFFSPMTTKFGGKSGNGIVGKSVRVVGEVHLVNEKPALTLATTRDIDPLP